jgi:CBS domain-containing protein
MLVRDLMETDVVSATPNTPITEVAKLMKSKDVGAVVILNDGGDLAGIVTDRDIVIKHVAEGHMRECPVSEVMTAERPIAGLVTIRPDMSIEEAAQELGRRKVGRLPVVDHGRVVGIVSAGDITKVARRTLDSLMAEGEKASDASAGAMGEPTGTGATATLPRT